MIEAVRHLAAVMPESDVASWLAFIATIAVLLAVDVNFLQAPERVGRVSFATAARLTFFWFSAGLLFDAFILGHLGAEASWGFLQGFLLEYMLSFDNLFVFHMVFSYYCTPEALLHRALHYGIAGAIVLRVLFLLIGYTFLSSGLYIVKLCLGAVLIYSGYKAASDIDEEETADNRFIAWISQNLPVSDHYEPNGNFFIDINEVEAATWVGDELNNQPVARPFETSGRQASMEGLLSSSQSLRHESTETVVVNPRLPSLESFDGGSLLRQEAFQQASALPRLESFESGGLLQHGAEDQPKREAYPGGEQEKHDVESCSRYEDSDLQGADHMQASSTEAAKRPKRVCLREGSSVSTTDVVRKTKTTRKASLLLLVVVAVWVVDVVFAVDSVASKLATVSDVFLNCASSAFAMMSLRSLYFVMESLTQTFQMLKYGIAAVLVLIGFKLVFAYWFELSNGACFAMILALLLSSVMGSYWMPQLKENCECVELGVTGTIFEEGEEEEGRDLFERSFSRSADPPESHQQWHGRDALLNFGSHGKLEQQEISAGNLDG
eukprot:TRINITY_DN62961_c0_g1_i1.p1 TRINITY_DN62961_c0_g1~~TRINITY_DN62961_c0_g1_i1.p1  ORF type:complete len:552 (-),score=136.44 TRINITY_DN62961_c0_g1_i1:45-1700(-)